MAKGNTRNLKRGGRDGKPATRDKQQRADAERVRKISQELVNNPVYLKKLKTKLDEGTAHPSLQIKIWEYAWGKPPENPDAPTPVPVVIKHVYADDEEAGS